MDVRLKRISSSARHLCAVILSLTGDSGEQEMMDSQSFHRFQYSPRIAEPDAQQQPDQPTTPPGFFRRLWRAWLWLTGPRPERLASSLADQERLRRSRLVSALLLLVAVVIALLIPSALTVPNLWQPM